jgi:hypothetical protein
MTIWTIHPDARLGVVGARLRFMAAPLAVTNLTAGGPRPCPVAPCGFPDVTWGCAISVAQQHGVGVGFRHRERLVVLVTAINKPLECGPFP